MPIFKLLAIIFLISFIFVAFILWIIYFGTLSNLSFFKIKYRLLSLFSTSEKMDKLNQESIDKSKEDKKEITIIIHGAAANYYRDIYGTAVWLREQGINAVSFDFNYKDSPDISAEKLNLYVDDLLNQTGTQKVNIVGFCLGGSLAEYYAEKYAGFKKIGKLVTVLSPLKPMPESGFFYKIDKLIFFNPDPWNDATSYLQNRYPVADTLHIYGKKDIIIPTKYQIPDKGNSVGLDVGHSPLINVDPEILNITLKFINGNN